MEATGSLLHPTDTIMVLHRYQCHHTQCTPDPSSFGSYLRPTQVLDTGKYPRRLRAKDSIACILQQHHCSLHHHTRGDIGRVASLPELLCGCESSPRRSEYSSWISCACSVSIRRGWVRWDQFLTHRNRRARWWPYVALRSVRR